MRHSLEVLPLQCSTTPIHIETKSSEDKEIEDFVDRKEKEKVNPASQDQESIQKGSFSSDNPTTEVQSAVSSEIVGASTMVLDTEHHFSEIKIPYNQKVEQGLMRELSAFINEKALYLIKKLLAVPASLKIC
ncbi:6103_t:CDS:2 [Entrophospora sp. SA101]|nr:6103_t:CDS:2 [Entrophospora sp. SA101]